MYKKSISLKNIYKEKKRKEKKRSGADEPSKTSQPT